MSDKEKTIKEVLEMVEPDTPLEEWEVVILSDAFYNEQLKEEDLKKLTKSQKMQLFGVNEKGLSKKKEAQKVLSLVKFQS